MALDEALARCLEPGRAVLRLYGWTSPTVSFGRNEPARDVYRFGAAPPAHRVGAALDFVRRPTGGRAVLHDAEVTYAVIAPFGALGGAREAYRRINEALAAALRSLGADVEVVGAGMPAVEGPSGTPALDSGPCFRSPAPGEVVARGRKLVGSAQARIGRTLLQHGSVILRGDQSALAALASVARPKVRSAGGGGPAVPVVDDRPATLEELIGPVAAAVVEAAVARSVTEAFGGRSVESSASEEEKCAARTLVETRYGRAEWTWRR